MRFFESYHIFKDRWDTVAQAFFQKYPNQLQPHVQGTLTLHQDFSDDRLRIHRFTLLNYQLPKIIQRMMKSPIGVAFELISCDRNNKILTICGGNISFLDKFQFIETCIYQPHPECPDWTLYNQKTSFSLNFFGLKYPVECAIVRFAKETRLKGVQVIEQQIEKILRARQDESSSFANQP